MNYSMPKPLPVISPGLLCPQLQRDVGLVKLAAYTNRGAEWLLSVKAPSHTVQIGGLDCAPILISSPRIDTLLSVDCAAVFNGRSLPLAEESIDMAFMPFTLVDVMQQQQLLMEIHTTLQMQGHLCVLAVQPCSVLSAYLKYKQLTTGSTDVLPVSNKRRFIAEMQSAGFELDQDPATLASKPWTSAEQTAQIPAFARPAKCSDQFFTDVVAFMFVKRVKAPIYGLHSRSSLLQIGATPRPSLCRSRQTR